MNAYKHAEISVHKRGGKIADYIDLHDFIDNTKELCSDNRHRILHTMWGVKRVIVPIFGHSFVNSDGKIVNVKDICEQDHILPDYANRFIPTLSDFVAAMDDDPKDLPRLNEFFKAYAEDKILSELLLSPLSNTGHVKSLLLTHNSWFLNEIVPKVLGYAPKIQNFGIAPADFFNRMNFELWMDNGSAFPPSAQKLRQNKLKIDRFTLD
jgi:hypothetical protein